MRRVIVRLNTIDRVKKFSDIIQHYDGTFEIAYKDCMIPADSIMSIFATDLTKDMELYINCNKSDDFINSIKDLIVCEVN